MPVVTTCFRMDPARCVVRIHVGKAGVLAFAGHAHRIEIPLLEGTIAWDPEQPAAASCQARFATVQARVAPGELGEADRQKVQDRTVGPEVLNAARFPHASFRSTAFRPRPDGRWDIVGDLALAGMTVSITLQAEVHAVSSRLVARANTRFRQSLFGIEPVTAGIGTVRVRDELDVEVVVEAVPEP